MRNTDLKRAIADLQQALQANPAYSDSWFLLVQAYARSGDKEKSRATLNQWDAYKAAHPLQAAGNNVPDPFLSPLQK